MIKHNLDLSKDEREGKYVNIIDYEETFDLMTMQLQQGRRFRSLRIWFVLN